MGADGTDPPPGNSPSQMPLLCLISCFILPGTYNHRTYHTVFIYIQSLPPLPLTRASLTAQSVKNPPAMQETLVQFLGQEDPLEKG